MALDQTRVAPKRNKNQMTDLATLKERLVQAETALHLLVTGGQRQSVDVGVDGRVTYTAANVGELRSYIAGLQNTIARLDGSSRRGPLYLEV
ncbi:MAG: hypothetical protein GY835_18680 [bacterium]|nr:hypothetical protein [bacterium]